MMITIGDPAQEKCFAQALETTKSLCMPPDLRSLEILGEIQVLTSALVQELSKGGAIEASLIKRIMMFFGVTTVGKHTYGDILKSAQGVRTDNQFVRGIQEALVAAIELEIRRTDGADFLGR